MKNDTTSLPSAGPAPASSAPLTVVPSTSVSATTPLAARKDGSKKSADELMPIPKLPASGVGDHPAGFVLVALGSAIALWLRRASRA